MTIVQLEYLIAVADSGSFSGAAVLCNVTQPSLSVRIRNLEDELGVVLLNRDKKPITLTAIGREVVEQARRAVAGFNAIPYGVAAGRGNVEGVLRLAVIPTIAPYILHLFLPRFMKEHPVLEVEVRDMFTRDMVTGLGKDTVDVGILAGGFVDTSDITEETLYQDKFYLYVSPDSTLCGREQASVEDIDMDRLILLADGHCLRSQVLDLCKAAKLSQRSVNFESGSLETIMRMVSETGGMTILPQMATPFVSEDNLRCLIPFRKEVGATRDITMAVGPNFYKKAIYEALKKSILDMRNEQYFLI